MGFFEDDEVEDWNKVDADPFAIPVGVDVPAVIEKSFVKDVSGEPTWIITWRENVPGSTRRYSEFLKRAKTAKHQDPEKLANIKRSRQSQIVKVLTACGVDQRAINEAEPADIMGLVGVLRLFKNKGGYVNFGSFRVTDNGLSESPSFDMASVAASANEESYF